VALPIQHTIRYKTYLKTSLVEALQSAFSVHPDRLLRDTKVRLDYSFEEADYPVVLVRYYERDNQAAGIAHVERGETEEGIPFRATRRLYHGDIEFAIYALSSLDRDLISDTITQILSMPDLLAWTNLFAQRLYDPETWSANQGVPIEELGEAHLYHFMTINTDMITGGGESQVPAPWGAEDALLYQTSHRAPIFGEVLSLPLDVFYTVIERIRIFPYIGGLEPIPTGTPDPAIWR
jgi:hypothetical protein